LILIFYGTKQQGQVVIRRQLEQACMSNNNEKIFPSGEVLGEQYVVQQDTCSKTEVSAAETDKPLKRAMTKRHLVMISLGGAIGTGLF